VNNYVYAKADIRPKFLQNFSEMALLTLLWRDKRKKTSTLKQRSFVLSANVCFGSVAVVHDSSTWAAGFGQ